MAGVFHFAPHGHALLCLDLIRASSERIYEGMFRTIILFHMSRDGLRPLPINLSSLNLRSPLTVYLSPQTHYKDTKNIENTQAFSAPVLLSRHCILRFLQGKFTIVIGDCYICQYFCRRNRVYGNAVVASCLHTDGFHGLYFIDDTTNILATLVEQERAHLW